MEATSNKVCSRLVLEWKDQRTTINTPGDGEITLGKAAANDLQLTGNWVSNLHACITIDHGFFYIQDESTNGTFVQSEDEKVTVVHRNSLRLWGSGLISLGEPLSNESAIRFEYR